MEDVSEDQHKYASFTMNLYNLIFSNEPSVRRKRHILFWVVWCFYLTITYLIPTNWIPAWNFDGPMPHIERYGPLLASLRIMLAAVLLTFVHMLLAYGTIYYFLPLFISGNANLIWLTICYIIFVLLVACLNYLNFLLAFYLSTRFGFFEEMPGAQFIIPVWARQILFNYPTVLGIALTIKLFKNWHLKQQEASQMARDKMSAELKLLRAQIHPHFLFNTLNNIYSFIINKSQKASTAIAKLRHLLHYIMYKCNKPLVPLDMELKMLQGYIDLETIRYGDSFNLTFRIEGNANGKMISPLLLIPFLENSFKHGASQMLAHPWVNLHIQIMENELHFHLSNCKPLLAAPSNGKNGIGLDNVRKRLSILYPDKHLFEISADEMSYQVNLSIPIFGLPEAQSLTQPQNAANELV